MRQLLKIALCFLLSAHLSFVYAQDGGKDAEQQYLAECYYYSGLLGFNIDSMHNPELFKTISSWLGVKYCYSGDSKKGVDCSGFASEVYQDVFNKTLEGSAADIYKITKPLKKSQLKEGDLVFFKIRKKRVSHVGIYLSHNRFIHASVHEGVVISDLDEPYYKKYFYKGGRMKANG